MVRSRAQPPIHFAFVVTNLVFVCCPGTGKSLLLRAIIASLKKKHAKKPAVVSVTASTGMAASNIGGTFFGPPEPHVRSPFRYPQPRGAIP